MKHNYQVILILLAFFLVAQFIGLFVLNAYIDWDASTRAGEIQFKGMELGGVEVLRPELEPSTSFVYMSVAIIIGTLIILLLVKLNATTLWRYWFFFAVLFCLGISFGAFMNSRIALILSLFFAYFKVFRPNLWIQNLTELFMYSGLAVIFVPVKNLTSAIALLLIISVYDAYAVWVSKHMIKLAKFQTKANMFAGLVIPYSDGKIHNKLPTKLHHASASTKHTGSKSSSKKSKSQKHMISTAILGGGDVGFPLIFAGVVMKTFGLHAAIIIPITAALGLGFLFYQGQNGKFYPAMPPITIGCLLGLGLIYLL